MSKYFKNIASSRITGMGGTGFDTGMAINTKEFTNVPIQPLPVRQEVQYNTVIQDATSIQAGINDESFHFDQQGIWLGAQQFTDAPFKVDMAGNLTATSATIAKQAGTILYQSADTERSVAPDTYTKQKEIKVLSLGTYTVKFSMRTNNVNNTAYGKIYVNGSAVGTERTNATVSYVEYSEDITVVAGDLIQLYIHRTPASGYDCLLKEFRLYVSSYDTSTVTLD